MTYLSDGFARADEEPLACMGEIDAAVMANEKSRPDFVFQIPDTSADGRFLNVQRLRRTSKASILGSRNNVAKMAQLDCQGTFFLR